MQTSIRMSARDTQLANEYTYSRKHIDGYIRQEITDNQDMMDKIDQSVILLDDWLSKSYFPSKDARLAQIKPLDKHELIMNIFIGITYCQTPELYTSVTAQLASRLNFNDKKDSIRTVAEIVAVICETDAYDIYKESKQGSLMIKASIPISRKLINYVTQTTYLPPMVCKPEDLTTNYSSPYLTHDSSVILGNNHHNDPISLDVINKQNQTELALDMDFLSTVEEQSTFDLDTVDKVKTWDKFKTQSLDFVALISTQADAMHLTHSYDKRGRLYTNGYHISTMGTAYKKASVNFAKQIMVDVPEEYRL